MADWNRFFLGKQAKELGFVRDTYEKVCRLKGGTAINLTIFDLPRLSVDIDLDFLENLDRDEMMASRAGINDRIGRFMTANGYKLSMKSKQYHALDSLVYEYSNSGGAKDNIKVEINYMLRCHILPIGSKRFESTWEPAGVSILSVAPIEIFASKIVALLNRTAARDLYDISNLLKFELLEKSEETILRKCVVFYSAISSRIPPSEFELSNIDQLTLHRIKTDLYPLLRNDEKFDLQVSQIQVKTWLVELLKLEDNEWKFLKAFRNKDYRLELLFQSNEILERISSHPMALWKCSQ
ncbi:MAG: hypothetical protein XD91_1610 [Clostridiales bacterium 38_11]|nr:MAG: hypothetical protein XD91_1610 [Clostridiales bacterium 38_11]HBH13877.1 nucleotidyl transferase AbiEii/AbiGii toxin family protein [Clostridiales bacterium]